MKIDVVKLARRVAELERKLDHAEAATTNVTQPETRSCLANEEIRPLAQAFVASLGKANREVLEQDLNAGHRRGGQVVRALRNALNE